MITLKKWWHAQNSPLFVNPQILDELLKYVYLLKDLEAGYRARKAV
jgi:hypothetical protein